MLQFLTILGYILGVVVGGISIYEFIQKKNPPGTVYASVAAAILIASLVLTFLNPHSGISTGTPTPTPTSTVGLSALSSPSPTDTTPTSTALPSPTPTVTVSPSPAATPTLAPAETLNKNIKLSCNCSDRVVATITKIVVQPDQNRMLWSMTFFNNSQKSADVGFGDGGFYLQEGDQINNPAPGAPEYDATGSVVGTFNGITLQAGGTQQVIITFSFVPYTATPYTLITIMQMDCCAQEIAHFNPVLFSF